MSDGILLVLSGIGVPVIGFLGFDSPDLGERRMRAFHQGLGETGHEALTEIANSAINQQAEAA